MKTDDLISALAADAPTRAPDLRMTWTVALAGAAAVAAIVFFATIGPRADIATAMQSIRFMFKFVVTISLAASAVYLLDRLARPGASSPGHWLALLAAPALLAMAIVLELTAQPAEQWSMLTTGKNSLVCLTFIPLIGIGPLGIMILALRRGAPLRPMLAGVVAGILAGAVAATFYAAHCTDDSPLFVATWYTLAIGILAVAGGVAGKYVARW